MLDVKQFDAKPTVKKHKLNLLPDNPEQADPNKAVGPGRFPSWLHRSLPKGNNLWLTSKVMRENHLHTVCEEAKCPNLMECWSKKTATFLVMGKECTRACGFCDIAHSKAPPPLDEEEPKRVADSVKQLGLKHVVITMVARDDLPDGGALHLTKVMEKIRQEVDEVTIEVLTSDLAGNWEALDRVIAAKPEIFNHNIETTREWTSRVRHKATYERTLQVLQYVKKHSKEVLVKSGLMVGLGEKQEEVLDTLRDLRDVGCDIVTIGQYLQATRLKLRVKSFVTPEQFQLFTDYGHSIGIPHMYCGPFVRSSYNADLFIRPLS